MAAVWPDTAALAAYMAAEWPELVAEVGIVAETIAASVDAVRAANPALDAEWAYPLADYFILRRAVRAFAVDFDVTVDGDSFRLSQRKQVAELFAAAAAKVGWLITPDDAGIGEVITVRREIADGIGVEW